VQKIFIQEQVMLDSVCKDLSHAKVLAIDTEFVRTRTLYPKLGLLQVSDGKQLVLIDPLAVDDLSAFWQLLMDANIVKVLHACSEDLEVFLTAANCRPVNLIDSQIIMSFLGHGLSMGYAAMVKYYLDIELDKSESRTDWTARPLSARQLEYAQADVEYLFQLYPIITKQLSDKGWLEAAQQDTELLIERKFTAIDETQLYRSVKMSWRLSSSQLYRLKTLAIWRFQQAQKKDLPIGFIAKDHTLIAVAQTNPETISAMNRLDGIELFDVRRNGKAMLALLKTIEPDHSDNFPDRIQRLDEYPGYKQIFQQVKSFITKVAKNSDLLPEKLASRKQINQYLAWHFQLNNNAVAKSSVDILLGWRFTLFGEELTELGKNQFAH
jgi:ribonuclease D